MAGSHLESITAVAASHQPAEPPIQRPPASGGPRCPHRRRQSVRASRDWVPSVYGPRPNSNCVCEVPVSTAGAHNSPENAARERSRVRNLRQAFHSLQAALPSVPRDTKLSKLDVLVLATNYIAYLTQTLDQGRSLSEHTLPSRPGGYLHPVKKWPMRSLLYCGQVLSGGPANQRPPSGQDAAHFLGQALEGDKDC
ncbi:transcription factor 23-like isoform X2 [Entelurus aequoreus]|uniref:transcription factor 23-like isoform X2 n=1 Tax=Entelurus aequoreus TaxID=161455 RepID=UPI002B1D03A4|nr:transcription factor 23-like isoform X2 [Entelurus aequoreus]